MAVNERAAGPLCRGEIDWERDDLKIMLVSDDYRPLPGRDATVGEVQRFEIAPSGTYERGGISLPDRQVFRGDRDGETLLYAGPVAWRKVTAAFRWAAVYAAGDGRLLKYIDFGRTQEINGNLTIDGGVAITVNSGHQPQRAFDATDEQILASLLA